MDELNYLKKWLDRNIDEHTTAPIGEIDTKTLAEAIIKEGFSRRPELDEDAILDVMHENRTRDYGGTAIEYEDFRKVATAICKRFKNGKS